MIKLVSFMNHKSNRLFESGIIMIPLNLDCLEAKYSQIMKDFKSLNADQQVNFEKCFENWCEKQ